MLAISFFVWTRPSAWPVDRLECRAVGNSRSSAARRGESRRGRCMTAPCIEEAKPSRRRQPARQQPALVSPARLAPWLGRACSWLVRWTCNRVPRADVAATIVGHAAQGFAPRRFLHTPNPVLPDLPRSPPARLVPLDGSTRAWKSETCRPATSVRTCSRPTSPRSTILTVVNLNSSLSSRCTNSYAVL